MDGLSKINFWSNELSNINCFVINVPCFIGRLSKFATKLGVVISPSFTTAFVTSSDIANVKDVSFTDPTQTKPLFNSTVSGGLLDGNLSLNATSALAAVLERGVYPMLRARDTTFSRSVAESKKDSFTIIFELNAVM